MSEIRQSPTTDPEIELNNLREAGSTEGHGATGSPADPQSREDDSPAVLDSLKEPPWDILCERP